MLGARQAPAPPPPNFEPVLGRWYFTVQGATGPYPSWVQVQLRKETELQGRFVGQFGSVRNITKIGYGDGTLAFDVPVQDQDEQERPPFRRQACRRHAGRDHARSGRRGPEVDCVRAPAFGPDKSVTWGAPLELFNGRDLSGWKPRSAEKPGCWSVVEGTLTLAPPCVDLVSERTFGDAKLHVEFMYPAKANSGLYLRGRYEVQIQDDAGKALDALRMGGVYGFIRPYIDAARPRRRVAGLRHHPAGPARDHRAQRQDDRRQRGDHRHHRRRARQRRGHAWAADAARRPREGVVQEDHADAGEVAPRARGLPPLAELNVCVPIGK